MKQLTPQIPRTPMSLNIETAPQIIYSKECSIYNQGNLNLYKIKPQVVSENCVADTGIIGLQNSTSIFQVFKASSTTLSTIRLKLHYQFSALDVIDKFDTYEDTSELQQMWNSSNINRLTPSLSSISPDNTNSMAIYTNSRGDGHTITKTESSTLDWSDKTKLSFWWKQTEGTSRIQYRVRLEDYDGEVVEHDILVNSKNTWEYKEYDFDDFDAVGWGTFDYSKVKKIVYYCYDASRNGYVYVDSITASATEAEGDNFKVELYKFNSANAPTASNTLNDFTKLTNDEGMDRVTIVVNTLNPSLYEVQIPFGITNSANMLEKDAYYMIALTSIDDDIIYVAVGEGNTCLYMNGKTFYTTNNQTLTLLENTTMFFVLYCSSDFMLHRISMRCDAPPKRTNFRLGIIRGTNVDSVLLSDIKLYDDTVFGEDILPVEIKSTDTVVFYCAHDNSSMLHTNLSLHGYYKKVPLNN